MPTSTTLPSCTPLSIIFRPLSFHFLFHQTKASSELILPLSERNTLGSLQSHFGHVRFFWSGVDEPTTQQRVEPIYLGIPQTKDNG